MMLHTMNVVLFTRVKNEMMDIMMESVKQHQETLDVNAPRQGCQVDSLYACDLSDELMGNRLSIIEGLES